MAERSVELVSVPDALPVLPLRDTVVYPDMVAPALVGQARSLELVNDVVRSNRLTAIVVQKSPEIVPARPDDLYRTGTMGMLHELARSENTVRLAIQGLVRIRILEFIQTQPYLVARITPAYELDESGLEMDALVRTAKDL